MTSVPEKYALVTGGTSGIGLELARLLAADKYGVVLVARSGEDLRRVSFELEETYGLGVLAIASDLSQPGSPQHVADTLERQGIVPEILVNSAGFATHGPFASSDLAGQESLVGLNVSALTVLTRLMLPGMLASKKGRILNLASTAAFLPGPQMAAYYASKAYVLSFSQALSYELRATGVTVTCLCPGPTKTGFAQRAGLQESPLFKNAADVRTVASAGYAGMLAGKDLVIPGFLSRLKTGISRFIPRRILLAIAAKAQD